MISQWTFRTFSSCFRIRNTFCFGFLWTIPNYQTKFAYRWQTPQGFNNTDSLIFAWLFQGLSMDFKPFHCILETPQSSDHLEAWKWRCLSYCQLFWNYPRPDSSTVAMATCSTVNLFSASILAFRHLTCQYIAEKLLFHLVRMLVLPPNSFIYLSQKMKLGDQIFW